MLDAERFRMLGVVALAADVPLADHGIGVGMGALVGQQVLDRRRVLQPLEDLEDTRPESNALPGFVAAFNGRSWWYAGWYSSESQRPPDRSEGRLAFRLLVGAERFERSTS